MLDLKEFHPEMPAALRRVGQHWEESHRTLLALEWVITSAVPYGATDGLQLLINPAGIADWSLGEVAFLLVHEARHVDLLHPVRFKGWVHAIANQAGDYVINGEIHRVNRAVFASHKFTPFPLPEGILLDPVLSAGDLSASDVYRILLAAGNTPPPPSNPVPSEEEGESGDGESGDGESGDGESGDGESGDGESGDGESGDGESGDGESGTTGNGRPGTAGSADVKAPAPQAGETVEQAEHAARDLVEAVAINRALDQKATVGAGTSQRKLYSKAESPQVDWRDILREFLDSATRSGWDRPFNPQLWGGAGLIAAGRGGVRSIGELVVVVDTSGSLGDAALRRILGEIGEIGREIKIDRITLLPHDHQVYTPIEIEAGQPVPDSLPGGGGTEFAPVLRWIEDNAADTVGVVWITDGDTSDWSSCAAPTVPVLWGHIPNWFHQRSEYPFGTVFDVPVTA
jgi:predicted metal-dependent peptidase